MHVCVCLQGDYTLEPTYNFVKQAPAVAVTRKMSAKDTLKLSYDIKSEAAAAEWNRKPFKVRMLTVALTHTCMRACLLSGVPVLHGVLVWPWAYTCGPVLA